MKDNDLKRNASGYYDEPCYQTVTAPPKPGEIWTHKTSGAYMLVVSSLNGVYSTLRLTDVEREGGVKVMCKTPMYATPIMLGYCFENMLADFVKAVKCDEFTAVQRAVGKVLGVIDINLVAPVPHDHIHALEEKVRNLTDENEGLKQSYKDIFNGNEKLRLDLKAVECERKEFNEAYREMSASLEKANVYREMYMELLDKLISARAVL